MLIAEPGLSDTATLATTATVAGSMPLGNLQTMQPTARTRFTDISSPIVFTIDMTAGFASGAYASWNYLWLGFGNFAVTDLWKIEGATTIAGLSSPTLIQAFTSCWPSPNLARFFPRRHARYFSHDGGGLPVGRTEKVLRVTIDATSNPDGFLEMGRAYASDGYLSQYIAYPNKLPTLKEEPRIVVAEGGARYPRPSGIDSGGVLPVYLAGADARADFYGRVQAVYLLRGGTKDVLLDRNPTDADFAMHGMTYGLLTGVHAPEYAFQATYTVELAVEGLR
jgi:hypothetical protein